METDNPHNFKLVDEIMRQALSASLMEAYLEAAPHNFIQMIVMIKNNHLDVYDISTAEEIWLAFQSK